MCISQSVRIYSNLLVDIYSFNKVSLYKYLGVSTNSKNNVRKKIQKYLASANRCYYCLLKLFRSMLLLGETKTTLCTSYFRLVIINGYKTWANTNNGYSKLSTTERKWGPKNIWFILQYGNENLRKKT